MVHCYSEGNVVLLIDQFIHLLFLQAPFACFFGYDVSIRVLLVALDTFGFGDCYRHDHNLSRGKL